jgi:hypothetical protein
LYEANRVKENFPNLNEFIFDYKWVSSNII